MGQFVRQKSPAFGGRGRESTRRERDVASDCICVRVYRASRFGRPGIAVDADTAEIVSKARFEKGASCRIERFTGRS
jgi:hypothetical protein